MTLAQKIIHSKTSGAMIDIINVLLPFHRKRKHVTLNRTAFIMIEVTAINQYPTIEAQDIAVLRKSKQS